MRLFTLFYEILESLSYHFVRDEHYCHFDDMYSPGYTCGDMLDAIVKKLKDGVVAESDLKYLSEAMDKVFTNGGIRRLRFSFCHLGLEPLFTESSADNSTTKSRKEKVKRSRYEKALKIYR